MPYTTYNCDALTGGAARALDAISVGVLGEGDRAIVAVGDKFYYFVFNSNGTAAENVATHPFIIRPDDYATEGNWEEQEPIGLDLKANLISPSLVTPDLGTPSAGVLTNCSGLPTGGILDEAVTYAKIQDVSATDKLLGRSTAGAGVVEEIPCTPDIRTLLDNVVAQGDLIYGSAANILSQLAKGAANTKLFMNANANAPEWAAGMKLGAFSRDLAAAAGSVATTGVGFKPSHVIFLSAVTNNTGNNLGFDNGSVGKNVMSFYVNTPGNYQSNHTYSIRCYPNSGGGSYANISQLDADGFTLTWVKDGSPTGTLDIFYLAFR